MAGRFQRLSDYLKDGIWRIRLARLPLKKALPVRFLRILILSVREFGTDKCQLRASALTFYSLTSIVPVVAMLFGIAKGFGFEKVLESQLREKLAGQEEILERVIEFSRSMLATAQGGLIAGVGLIVLFWAVINVLGQIEDSMSDIWKIRKQRSFGRKFSDYLSVMLICPVLIIVSSSVTVFVTTQVTLILEKIDFLGALSPVVLYALRLIPLMLVWSVFTFLYIFMPNTKVRFSSGLLAGIVAGSVFQFAQWLYITFQVFAASYNAIYGSFAALPLFLIWLQASWLIVLFGAELSYAAQNVDEHEFEPDCTRASHHLRTLLSVRVMRHLVRTFVKEETPLSADRISNELDLPRCMVNEITSELLQTGLVSVAGSDGERGFQPARDINIITVQYVMEALDRRGINEVPFAGSTGDEAVTKALESFEKTIEKLPSNKLLKDL